MAKLVKDFLNYFADNEAAKRQRWLEEANADTYFTPDTPFLESKLWWYFFVYDNMMIGRREYDLIRDESEFVYTGFTQDHFSMWKRNLDKGSFPVPLVPSDPNNITEWDERNRYINRLGHHGVIKGQLFKVNTQQIFKLDIERRNGLIFDRKRIVVEVPLRYVRYYGEKGIETKEKFVREYEAWMYVGSKDYWDQQIDAGFMFSPVTLLKPVGLINKVYYYFNNS